MRYKPFPESERLVVVNITLNDAPLTEIVLSQENSVQTSLRLPLQESPLASGRNTLEISLDTGAECNAGEAQLSVDDYRAIRQYYSLLVLFWQERQPG